MVVVVTYLVFATLVSIAAFAIAVAVAGVTAAAGAGAVVSAFSATAIISAIYVACVTLYDTTLNVQKKPDQSTRTTSLSLFRKKTAPQTLQRPCKNGGRCSRDKMFNP